MEATTKDQKDINKKKTEGKMLTGMFSDRESLERSYDLDQE